MIPLSCNFVTHHLIKVKINAWILLSEKRKNITSNYKSSFVAVFKNLL